MATQVILLLVVIVVVAIREPNSTSVQTAGLHTRSHTNALHQGGKNMCFYHSHNTLTKNRKAVH